MDFENKKRLPSWILAMGWFISMFAFVLGFYHTAEGMKFFKPLGFEGGAFIVSALISMLLIVSYSRAVAGVKVALVFYIICALFNFTFNLNSFYPNLNSRKLLQEEAQQIKDTLEFNRSMQSKIFRIASSSDITGMENYRDGVIAEITKSKGFGFNAKKNLTEFNKISSKYGSKPILEGSFDVKNMNAATHFKQQMDNVLSGIQNGTEGIANSGLALKQFNEFLKLADSKNHGAKEKTFSDITFQEIRDNQKTKDEDTTSYNKSIRKLGQLVEVNDLTAIMINGLNLKYIDSATNKMTPIKMKVLNNDPNAQLLFPKSKEVGKFNHTIDSIVKRIDKIDTWGVIILVFFIDFLVPFAIYFLIRKRENEGDDDGRIGGQSGGFWSKLFGEKKPEQF
jgi:hypothetical protein